MPEETNAKDWVAIVLTIGLCLALNVFTFSVFLSVLDNMKAPDGGLSENATQVLTGAFGGIIGVVGSYLGFRAGSNRRVTSESPEETTTEASDETGD